MKIKNDSEYMAVQLALLGLEELGHSPTLDAAHNLFETACTEYEARNCLKPWREAAAEEAEAEAAAILASQGITADETPDRRRGQDN